VLLKIKLFATFRKGRFKEKQLDFPDESSVDDLLEHLKIPSEKLGILLVNGRNTSLKQTLTAHDVVSIFPSIGGG